MSGKQRPPGRHQAPGRAADARQQAAAASGTESHPPLHSLLAAATANIYLLRFGGGRGASCADKRRQAALPRNGGRARRPECCFAKFSSSCAPCPAKRGGSGASRQRHARQLRQEGESSHQQHVISDLESSKSVESAKDRIWKQAFVGPPAKPAALCHAAWAAQLCLGGRPAQGWKPALPAGGAVRDVVW